MSRNVCRYWQQGYCRFGGKTALHPAERKRIKKKKKKHTDPSFQEQTAHGRRLEPRWSENSQADMGMATTLQRAANSCTCNHNRAPTDSAPCRAALAAPRLPRTTTTLWRRLAPQRRPSASARRISARTSSKSDRIGFCPPTVPARTRPNSCLEATRGSRALRRFTYTTSRAS